MGLPPKSFLTKPDITCEHICCWVSKIVSKDRFFSNLIAIGITQISILEKY